jgi:hypothetical protein
MADLTPIERAARALHRSQEWPSDKLLASMSPAEREEELLIAQQVEDDGWREHVDDVRAVIAAIREPSEAMVSAGNKSKPYNVTGWCEGTIHPVVQRSWPAMIDALLNDGVPQGN